MHLLMSSICDVLRACRIVCFQAHVLRMRWSQRVVACFMLCGRGFQLHTIWMDSSTKGIHAAGVCALCSHWSSTGFAEFLASTFVSGGIQYCGLRLGGIKARMQVCSSLCICSAPSEQYGMRLCWLGQSRT